MKKIEYLPPLMRGIGFLIIFATSLVVGAVEQGERKELLNRIDEMEAQDPSACVDGLNSASSRLMQEVRILRIQLEADDLADSLLENPWFQALGALGSLVVALSFIYEAMLRRK